MISSNESFINTVYTMRNKTNGILSTGGQYHARDRRPSETRGIGDGKFEDTGRDKEAGRANEEEERKAGDGSYSDSPAGSTDATTCSVDDATFFADIQTPHIPLLLWYLQDDAGENMFTVTAT